MGLLIMPKDDNQNQGLKHVSEERNLHEVDYLASTETRQEVEERHKKDKDRLHEDRRLTAVEADKDKDSKKHGEPPKMVADDLYKILESISNDRDISTVIQQYQDIKPWEAMKELPLVSNRDDTEIDYARSFQAKEKERPQEVSPVIDQRNYSQSTHDLQDYQPKINREDNPRHSPLERDEPIDIACDNEDFACVIPVIVANKLAEFGTIEPETMVYLREKYGYLDKYISPREEKEGQQHGVMKNMEDAALHAKMQMKPARDRKSPIRQERAREQIEILQEESERSCFSPRIHHYTFAIARCDCKDGYFVIWASELVGWDKITIHTPRIERTVQEPTRDRDDCEYERDDEFDR